MARSKYVPHSRKTYAATAQAEYDNRGWHGSLGLRSTRITAPSLLFAEQKARAFYKQEWLKERSLEDRLIKLHISVVAL